MGGEPKLRKVKRKVISSESERTTHTSATQKYSHCLYQKLYEESNNRSDRQIDHQRLCNKIADLPIKFPDQIEQINQLLYSLVLYHHYRETNSLVLYPYGSSKKKKGQVHINLMDYPPRLRLILAAFIEQLSED